MYDGGVKNRGWGRDSVQKETPYAQIVRKVGKSALEFGRGGENKLNNSSNLAQRDPIGN